MDSLEFIDALTGDLIVQDQADGSLAVEKGSSAPDAKSIFFPGCSMINYAMPLVRSTYELLLKHGEVDGISLLCCGKILSYEPNGDTLRSSFESQLRERLSETTIERIVCACPNCVKALREALALDERTSKIELVVLPKLLADIGYRVAAAVAAKLLKDDPDSDVMLCIHDSCPDREYGDFADGLRAILPEGIWADPAHCRSRSICCGSLPRAAGKVEAADRCADICGTEALDVHADAIVTACMSCAFQLNMAQSHLPAVHFLELLFDWRIDWSRVGQWMKIRFLFDETLGVVERSSGSGRAYAGLGGDDSCLGIESDAMTISDDVRSLEGAGHESAEDDAASRGVDISGEDVEVVGL